MDATVEFLVTYAFETPFDFFQQFGIYWADRGWSKIGHQLEDLFTRLLEFLCHAEIRDLDIALALMKFDYLSRLKYKPRKIWWEDGLTKEERAEIFRGLPQSDLPEALKNLSEREWMKHVVAEKMPIDLPAFLQSKKIVREDHYLLFYYDGKGECRYFQI
jgi:hypothetical protein